MKGKPEEWESTSVIFWFIKVTLVIYSLFFCTTFSFITLQNRMGATKLIDEKKKRTSELDKINKQDALYQNY